jgi:hypothetical protein
VDLNGWSITSVLGTVPYFQVYTLISFIYDHMKLTNSLGVDTNVSGRTIGGVVFQENAA